MSSFYGAPSYMSGGFTTYSGVRRQRGGNILGALGKLIVPAGRTALKGIMDVAKSQGVRRLAQKGVEQAVAVGTSVALDALQGRNVGESIKQRSREAALAALTGPTQRTVAAADARKAPVKRKREFKQNPEKHPQANVDAQQVVYQEPL